MGIPLTDLTGRQFDRLVVVGFADRGDGGRARWRVRCQCGVEKVVAHRQLLAGASRSCGCLQRETVATAAAARRSHGGSESLTYSTWCAMKTRCTNPHNDAYPDY